MLKRTKGVCTALALLALLWAPAPAEVRADFVALTDFPGFQTFASFDNTNMTVGWRFTVNSDIMATFLGFWDQTPNTPLGQAHQVGLWAADSTLLASTTVQVNSALTGSFRYEAIAPVLLTAGSTYVIGAAINAPFPDPYATFATSVTTASEITFVGDTRNSTNGGFSFPQITENNRGRFGPNFQFDAPIPEPSSAVLAAVGASLAGGAWWRKRRAAPAA